MKLFLSLQPPESFQSRFTYNRGIYLVIPVHLKQRHLHTFADEVVPLSAVLVIPHQVGGEVEGQAVLGVVCVARLAGSPVREGGHHAHVVRGPHPVPFTQQIRGVQPEATRVVGSWWPTSARHAQLHPNTQNIVSVCRNALY